MSPTIVGIVTILVGVVVCFYGYPLFRALLPILGFVLGYQIGTQLVSGDPLISLVIGIVFGVALFILSFRLFKALVALIGAFLGANMGYLLALQLGQASNTVMLIVFIVVGAILFAILFSAVRDLMVIVVTALNGALLIVYGVGQLVGASLTANDLVELIIVAVLATIGFAVQYRMFGRRGLYL